MPWRLSVTLALQRLVPGQPGGVPLLMTHTRCTRLIRNKKRLRSWQLSEQNGDDLPASVSFPRRSWLWIALALGCASGVVWVHRSDDYAEVLVQARDFAERRLKRWDREIAYGQLLADNLSQNPEYAAQPRSKNWVLRPVSGIQSQDSSSRSEVAEQQQLKGLGTLALAKGQAADLVFDRQGSQVYLAVALSIPGNPGSVLVTKLPWATGADGDYGHDIDFKKTVFKLDRPTGIVSQSDSYEKIASSAPVSVSGSLPSGLGRLTVANELAVSWLDQWPINLGLFSLTFSAIVFSGDLLDRDRRARKGEINLLSEKYKAVFEQSLDGVLLVRATTSSFSYLDCNDACPRLYGVSSREEVLALSPIDFSPELQPDGRPTQEVMIDLQNQVLDKGYCSIEWLHRRLDTGEEWLGRLSIKKIDYENSDLFMVNIHDITEEKQYQDNLQRLAYKYRAIFQQSNEAILVMTPEAVFIEASDAAPQLYGVADTDAFLSLSPLDFSPEFQPNGVSTADRASEVIAEALAVGSTTFQWLHKRVDTGDLWLGQVSMTRIELPEGPRFLVSVRDISEATRYQDQLRKLAYVDQLTGLPNYASSVQWISDWKSSSSASQSLLLIHFDIDNFQAINDSFGTEIGDQVLLAFSSCLSRRSVSGGLLSRLESDSFLLIHPDQTLEQGQRDVTDFQDELKNWKNEAYPLPVRITCSAGLVLMDRAEPLSPVQALQRANAAQSLARSRGFGALEVYSTTITLETERRLKLERQLERSVADGFKDFSLHYQPVIDRTGSVSSAEVLMRWTLPDGSSVPPSEFIPIAEKTGLIHPMSRWMLYEAATQLSQWKRNASLVQRIAVNISAVQLFDAIDVLPLKDLLGDVLSKSGLQPADLVLEITESALLDASNSTLLTLQSLVEMGFSLAIDDFGTGYSSMQQLQKVPATTIKIDQSFVRNLQKSQSLQAIVESTVFLSKRLGCTTVAEGVETEEQYRALTAFGCDYFQGYLFAKPMPASALEDFCRN